MINYVREKLELDDDEETGEEGQEQQEGEEGANGTPSTVAGQTVEILCNNEVSLACVMLLCSFY